MAQVGYERPPLVTAADISGRGASTLGSTMPGFGLMQQAAQAAGSAPVLTAQGPRVAPSPGLAAGILLILVGAYLLDRHVL